MSGSETHEPRNPGTSTVGSDGGTGTAPPPEAPGTGRPAGRPPGRSRLGSLWVMLVSGAVVLVLLLVFILMNPQRVEIHFFGAHLNAPVGVAMLLAAALGILLVVVPGVGRMIQLRRSARRAHARATALQELVPDASQAQPDASDRPEAPQDPPRR